MRLACKHPIVGELGYEPSIHGLLYTVNCAANSFPYVCILPRVWELCSVILCVYLASVFPWCPCKTFDLKRVSLKII